MSPPALKLVLAHSKAKGIAKTVLILLAWHANGPKWTCYPSLRTLAAEGGITERSVRRGIRELEALGEITVRKNATTDERIPINRRPNMYYINPHLGESDRTDSPPYSYSGGTKSNFRGDKNYLSGGTDGPPIEKIEINRDEESKIEITDTEEARKRIAEMRAETKRLAKKMRT